MSVSDFVIVANRLPVDTMRDARGDVIYRRSPGGLVTALEPLLAHRAGAWVGWIGQAQLEQENINTTFIHNGITIVPVPLNEREINNYYEGFSNATLWPLYHDVIERPQFHRQWWQSYQEVNQRFAQMTAQIAAPHATVWVQDYQLQLVPQYLRQLRPDVKIGFFLHIPFPPENLFLEIPSRNQLVEGLLGADLLGFQVHHDAHNFREVVSSLRHHAHARLSSQITVTNDGIQVGQRLVRVADFPISIDTHKIFQQASSPAVQQEAQHLRQELGNPRKIILGVDRLDYTKGIDVRLRAFKELLEDKRIDPTEVIYVQIAVPTREKVESYQKLRNSIELLVSRINGDWALISRPAVHYIHRNIPHEILLKFFAAADVMLVTPFKDGMNLVAKEYIACRKYDTGALVLSEFAGAAKEFTDAYIVNPHDIDDVKDAIDTALHQNPDEERTRIATMRQQVLQYDVHLWAKNFFETLESIHA